MKTNDEIDINALISEVEHYGIKMMQEVKTNLDGKG